MSYRTFKGPLGVIEPIGMASCSVCAAHVFFPVKVQVTPTPGAASKVADVIIFLFQVSGLCAFVYTQILRNRIGKDPSLEELYFKPLPEGAVPAATAETRSLPSRPVEWQWMPLLKLVVGLAIVAGLAGVFVFHSHRRHVAAMASNNTGGRKGQFFAQKVHELNKLAPAHVNGVVDFVEARVTGVGVVMRFNLVNINKTQITRSGAYKICRSIPGHSCTRPPRAAAF